MTQMKEFTTAAKTEAGQGPDREQLAFSVDGKILTSKRPTPAQMAYLASVEAGGLADVVQEVAAVINFLMAIMDEEGSKYLANRLLDGDDDFELDDVREILMYLMEEWTARPTKPSSALSSSSASDGSGSTGTSASEESIIGASTVPAPAM